MKRLVYATKLSYANWHRYKPTTIGEEKIASWLNRLNSLETKYGDYIEYDISDSDSGEYGIGSRVTDADDILDSIPYDYKQWGFGVKFDGNYRIYESPYSELDDLRLELGVDIVDTEAPTTTKPKTKPKFTGGFKYSFYSNPTHKSKQDIVEFLQTTDKPLKYTHGLKFRNPTTYQNPITVDDAIELVNSGAWLDITEKSDYVDINEYSANDMW